VQEKKNIPKEEQGTSLILSHNDTAPGCRVKKHLKKDISAEFG
jgi:hypothetical protein